MQQHAYAQDELLTTKVMVPIGHIALKVYPEFLLRSTGIPFNLIEPMRNPQALQAIKDYLALQHTLEQEQEHFLLHLWPQALERAWVRFPGPDPALKPFYNVNRQVRRLALLSPANCEIWNEYGDDEWAQRWNSLITQIQHAEEFSQTTYAQAFAQERRALYDTFQDQRLQEAVFLSNPGFFERAFSSWIEHDFQVAPSKSAKQCETIVHRYLRRFTSKCEATSFFGPTLFACLQPSQTAAMLVGPRQSEVIFVEASTWAIDELSRILSTKVPLEHIYARRNPIFREETNNRIVRILDGRSRVLSSDALTLWRHIDGKHELGSLATMLGFTQEKLYELVHEMKPLLVLLIEVHATAQHPLELLACYDSEDGPARQLLTLQNRFAQAPWPQRRMHFMEAEAFCRSLGLEARRGQGAHYADRSVFREDRSSPVNASLTFGQPVITPIMNALKALLPLCFVGAMLAREDARDSLRSVLDGKTVSLLQLARTQITDKGWRVQQLRTVLEMRIREKMQEGSHTLQVSSQEITHWLTPFWDLFACDDAMMCLPGPDLMAVGKDLHNATWVLAELHDDSSSVFGGNPAVLYPDTPGLWERFQSEVVRLVDPSKTATIISRRRSKHITPELPGIRIELSGRASPSEYETLPISEIFVDPDACGVHVDKRLLHLYPGDLSSLVHRALALPCVTPFLIDLGDFTPRIEIDGCVYQRARWHLELPASKGGFERWKLFHALREQYSLPERVYVRHPGEPKPFYIDFADPASIEDLGRLPQGSVSITEMLPGPDQLWWRLDEQAQCSEFRMAVLLDYKSG